MHDQIQLPSIIVLDATKRNGLGKCLRWDGVRRLFKSSKRPRLRHPPDSPPLVKCDRHRQMTTDVLHRSQAWNERRLVQKTSNYVRSQTRAVRESEEDTADYRSILTYGSTNCLTFIPKMKWRGRAYAATPERNQLRLSRWCGWGTSLRLAHGVSAATRSYRCASRFHLTFHGHLLACVANGLGPKKIALDCGYYFTMT